MEVSKRTTTRIGHLSPLTKNKKKKQKKYHLMIESLLSNNTSYRLKFIMTPNLLLLSHKWSNNSKFYENQGL